jgi:Leucine-rich repeat (LRR) protein
LNLQLSLKRVALLSILSIIKMPYNSATKTYTKTCNGLELEGSERSKFLKDLKTLPADVETIKINLITNLERLPDLGHYTALKTLNLYNIGLKVLDCILPDSLEILDISYNCISEMTTPLPNRLKALDISFNPIKVLPALPDTLTHLGCISCPIGALPPLPPFLEMLYAASCGLTSLPDLPKSLITVCISNNHIQTFPPFSPTITTLKIDW